MAPISKIKSGHGISKLHKPIIRPIISSINSLTSVAENFILKIINPLVEKVEKSISSTKEFKEELLLHKDKFDPKKHSVISYDAKGLYTNVNVKKTIMYILNQIYIEPSKYFNEQNEVDNGDPETTTTQKCPHIPRKIFRKFLTDTLLKYCSFHRLVGIFRQKEGLSMGSKISPAIANIYCHIMESQKL